jgi:RNA polymerase sigma-70 factor (ECF subfamily)
MTMPGTSLECAANADPNEAALLAGLRAGSDAAFEELVRTYGSRLLAVARRILGTDQDAEDAVQDALLSAAKSIQDFAGNSRVNTWLHRIVTNAALMRLRSRRRSHEQPIEDLLPRFKDDGHREVPVGEWTEPVEAAAEQAETRTLVRQCIDQLPETYRTILILRDIEEMDTEQAAQLLGVTTNVVKTRLHRARQALRTLLDPHFRRGAV